MFPFHQSLAAIAPVSPSLTLAWERVPETNIQGYRLYGGTVSKQYPLVYETGNVNRFTVNGLTPGETYYFAVRAIGSTGLEGALSTELVVAFIPQPIAFPDSYSTTQNSRLVVPANGVLTNDTDLDSALLSAVLDSGPLHGDLTLDAGGGFTYTPDPGFTGGDSFSYHTSDGYFDSESTIVSLAVNEPVFEMLSNGSFESGYTGWSAAGNQVIETAVSPLVPSDGARLVSFNSRNLSPDANLSQSFATVAGVTYTLEFDLSVISYNENSQSLLVNVNGTSSRLSEMITLTGNGVGVIPWRSYRFTFVADGSASTLTFRDMSLSSASIDLLLDNVSVSGPRGYQQIPPLGEGQNTPSLSGRPGEITVAMTVSAAGTYVLQRSEDLVTWETVGTTLAVEAGRISFLDTKPVGSSQTRMFYRIGPL